VLCEQKENMTLPSPTIGIKKRQVTHKNILPFMRLTCFLAIVTSPMSDCFWSTLVISISHLRFTDALGNCGRHYRLLGGLFLLVVAFSLFVGP
jgi:hypothetical protein